MAQSVMTGPVGTVQGAVTTLLLVRHADVHNPNEIVYGRLSRFHLSELGLIQAETTAKYLASERIAAVYSSPMLRARQTAQIIGRHHPEASLHYSILLTEVGTTWQGTLHRDMRPDFDFFVGAVERGDETVEDIARRMRRFVDRARRRHQGSTVVAVSHADPIAILRASLLGEPMDVQSFRRPPYPAKGSVLSLRFASSEAVPEVGYVDPVNDWDHVQRSR